jgi:hypothetical protein
MATFETSLVIPHPLLETFEFVTDLRNAPKWDPRTYEARKTTEGEIGLNTKFLLLGGLISKQTLDRLHVPDLVRQHSDLNLEYEVVSFVQGAEMVVRGETSLLRYEDRLRFSAEGNSTKLDYLSKIEVKGLPDIAEAALDPIFHAIGADATRGIPAAVEAALCPARYANPLVAPEDVERVVAMDESPVLRNLLITQSYHDLETAIRARTGKTDMNWSTLGTWASKTAGKFIRGEEITAAFHKLLAGSDDVLRLVDDATAALRIEGQAKPFRLVNAINTIVNDCASYIMVGNKVVYHELGRCCADFVKELSGDTRPDHEKLAAFVSRYRDGDPAPDEVNPHDLTHPSRRGGQRMLREMVQHLYDAMFETDVARRRELLLLANAKGGIHEQTRLQPYIAGGLDAPFADTLAKWAHDHVERDAPELTRGSLHKAVDAVLPSLGRRIERAWRDFLTVELMTLTLPCVTLHLGSPIPLELQALPSIKSVELSELLDRYRALEVRLEHPAFDAIAHDVRSVFGNNPTTRRELAEVAALDWADLDQRMRYILTLFRTRQQDEHLFVAPFTAEQRDTIREGRIPSSAL